MSMEAFQSAGSEYYTNKILPYGCNVALTYVAGRIIGRIRCGHGVFSPINGGFLGGVSVLRNEKEFHPPILIRVIGYFQIELRSLFQSRQLTPCQRGYCDTASE